MLKDIILDLKSRDRYKYDAGLEIDMFNEEVQKFFDASNSAERVRFLLDCMYVKLGTMCKLAYNGFDADDLPYSHKTTIDMMTNIVQTELGDNYMRVIKEAERIVCECNAGKGTKLKNGKVAKDAKVRNATEEIANLLEAISTETIEVED